MRPDFLHSRDELSISSSYSVAKCNAPFQAYVLHEKCCNVETRLCWFDPPHVEQCVCSMPFINMPAHSKWQLKWKKNMYLHGKSELGSSFNGGKFTRCVCIANPLWLRCTTASRQAHRVQLMQHGTRSSLFIQSAHTVICSDADSGQWP
jgi:hypothetical protein